MNNKLKYYVEFTDSKGIRHCAIHVYDRLTGFVDMMKDFKFEGFRYPCTDLETVFYQREHVRWIKDHRRFEVIPSLLVDGTYKIWDNAKDIGIASFKDKSEAEDYAEYRNGNEKYLN